MPLAWPPRQGGSLARFPSEPIRRRTIYRVWRPGLDDGTARNGPWWFASVPDDPLEGGRYDLAVPMGTCYTATRPVAVPEALQAFLTNLPAAELRVRRFAAIEAPQDAPAAAKLTAHAAAGNGPQECISGRAVA